MIGSLLPAPRQIHPTVLGVGIVLALVLLVYPEELRSVMENEGEMRGEPEAETEHSGLDPVNEEIFSCVPASFGYEGKSYAEESAEARLAAREREAAKRRAALRSEAAQPLVIPENPENPNSIRIPISQAPPVLSGERVGNKWVCKHKNDKPRKSKKFDTVHVDQQCCLDPDEIPNPRCDYSYRK